MAAHPPPVPPEQRNPHSGASTSKPGTSDATQAKQRDQDTREQGQSGNTAQNTTNKGLQQDR